MNWSKEKVAKFLKVGIVVLGTIAIFGLGIQYVPSAIPATSNVGRKLPIYCVDTEKKQVALTFDAAWGNEDTTAILECLKKYDVHVTFFMTGGWVNAYPDDVKAILAGGHDLGNHSETHKQMSKLTLEQCKEEIQLPTDKVKAITGKDMCLFRAPYGDYNNTLIQAASDLGYHCIQWDVDSLDWKDYGVDSIVSTVLNNTHLGNGSIILMHNGAKYTLQALPRVIEGLKEKGYEIVPVSQLIYQENYEMDQEGRQHQN